MKPKTARKIWHGKRPDFCDVCAFPIKWQPFVDGVMLPCGPWAIMCYPKCYNEHGAGLGIGRGQLYNWNKDTKVFEKVEG